MFNRQQKLKPSPLRDLTSQHEEPVSAHVGIWLEGEMTICVQEDNSEHGSILLYDVEYCDGDVEYGIPGSCLMPRR